MNSIRALLADRRRSQRGSVLSGVLIMTAFISIIAGALMTELSTNFLLSRDLMVRMQNEATVSSEVELALGQLQGTSVSAGCPGLNQTSLNGRTAGASYMTCMPTVDSASPQYRQIASGSPFLLDGTNDVAHSRYLVSDSAGTFSRYVFGQTSPDWTANVGGSTSAPPEAMPDGSTVLLPVVNPTAHGGCSPAPGCVALLNYPEMFPECYLTAAAPVQSRPAAGVNFPTLTYFGDASGLVQVYDTYGGNCVPVGTPYRLSQAVAAGPVVFRGQTGKTTIDDIYFVTSDELVWLEYSTSKKGPSLSFMGSQSLPSSGAVGVAADQTSNRSTAHLAITFSSGKVALASNLLNLPSATIIYASLPSGIDDAPTWCCGSSPTEFGVAQRSGLYIFDTNLNVAASYGLGGPIASATPAVDAAGDWFVGGVDGSVYEIPAVQSTPTVVALGSGNLGQLHSAVALGSCQGGWICAYVASANGAAYTFQLDARSAVLSACVIASPPSCSGVNPHLWASVEVGSATSPLTVRIKGWSYYSG
jgi:hypothetical protein